MNPAWRRGRRVARIAVASFASMAVAGAAGAEPLGRAASERASTPPPVRPQSFIDQLDYCDELIGRGEEPRLLAQCFGHAAALLEEALQRRPDASPPRSAAFESRLQTGGREIAERVRGLPIEQAGRLRSALKDLRREIQALRAELSRIAAAEHVDLSLISRGGVSLGNWQAGFLYAVTEWAKDRPGQTTDEGGARPAFSTVTGASAGAVNGLAAAVEGCGAASREPRASLYYRVWVDLGLFGRHGRAGLMDLEKGPGNPLALFSEKALEEILSETREAVLAAQARSSCAVDFGFVTTHLDRTTSPIHVSEEGTPILATKKLKEKFAVRLSFSADAPGTSASGLAITNLGPSGAFAGDRIYYADLGRDRAVPLDSLLLGVQASAAFPGAFPPVPLTYTQYVPGPEDTVLARPRAATFIDGGVLDNTPVGLAVSLDAWRDDGAETDLELEGVVPPPPRTYIFVEPEVRSWVTDTDRGGAAAARERDLLKVFLGFTGDLLVTSMDAQLSNTAEQYEFVRRERDDWSRPRLSVPRRHLPITGEQFYHFMAFLERDFRIFDFYVGMADAYEYLREESCLVAINPATCSVTPDLLRLDQELARTDPLYRCIRAFYETDAFAVLRRVDHSRLPPECSALRELECEGAAWEVGEKSVEEYLRSRRVVTDPGEDRCIERAISNHNFRTLLVAMHNYKVWMQSDQYAKELELDRFFDELGAEQRAERFVYVDLPTYQGSDEGFLGAAEIKQAFRSLMQDGLDRLAADQEGLGQHVLRIGGRTAADIAYQRDHPRRMVGVGIVQNGVETVFGLRLGRSAWRWDNTLRFYNIRREIFAPRLDPWTAEIYAATQVTRIFSPTKLADVELGAGWAISNTVAMSSSSPGQVAFRTGLRSVLTLVVIQRLYVGVNVDYYPVVDIEAPYSLAVDPVVANWQWNLTAGWRFLF